MADSLAPTQQQVLDRLIAAMRDQPAAVLSARSGMGKTRILHQLRSRHKRGVHLTSREFLEASAARHPLAIEETVQEVIGNALAQHDLVIVDDFQFIALLACCSHAYPRQNLLGGVLLPLGRMAQAQQKQLVLTGEQVPIMGVVERWPVIGIPDFTVADYTAICSGYLDADQRRGLDFAKIHRFGPKLNARQLRNTCVALAGEQGLTTDRFIDYLREHHMASNVDIAEVQAVELRDLKGVDDVLEALEANVIMPLENADIAEELSLKPKRGVLLAGPPGTGKTTIGRALARRLKSKFFLIDGTIISGTPDFFGRVHHVFEMAKQNAPSIIFIDDSDVIFESSGDTGLYRYLLTMLDGLESASAGRVCLMMTAMDVGNLPPALVRSGRIELWLETRLPSAEARADILADQCASLPAALQTIDVTALAEASDGLSGADLKRVIEDGKLLYAFERQTKSSLQPLTDYFLRAIETVRKNKEQYEQAEMRARMRQPQRPSFFDSGTIFRHATASGFASVGMEAAYAMEQIE